MSIKIMTMVFDRYPNGGGEMLLALSLADFADDNGTSVYPSIKQLSEKTRQSERSVQYQLRKMEESGWLVLVNSGNGGRNQRREYRISPEWIKGADFAPVQSTSEKGATDDTKGANESSKGCNGLHPHITVNEPSITVSKPPVRLVAPEGFIRFWDSYPNTPRRVAKAKCLKVWKDKRLEDVADEILAHVRIMRKTRQWLSGYEPAPLTYLNQQRWEDGDPVERAEHPASQGFDPLAYVNRNRTSRHQGDSNVIDM